MRLHFVVEGQTEETFVRDLLGAELSSKGIYCDAHQVTTRKRGSAVFRGGHVKYQHLRRDLELWMKQDPGADSWFTSMVDLYRLPPDFPGFAQSCGIADPIKKVEALEAHFGADLNHPRFVPYIQLHEFEALLFSDPGCFEIAFPSLTTQLADLNAIRSGFQTPEHINDGVDTSPSKRICALLPEYNKPLSGPLIAKAIGLAKIRAECRHFDTWLARLENIP